MILLGYFHFIEVCAALTEAFLGGNHKVADCTHQEELYDSVFGQKKVEVVVVFGVNFVEF